MPPACPMSELRNSSNFRFLGGRLSQMAIVVSFVFSAATHAGESSLADAVEQGSFDKAAKLIEGGASVSDAQVDGMTPLHWAAHHGNVELTKALLSKGADPKVENRYGIAPLYLSCINGSAELTAALLDAGADPDTSIRGGETALMTASRTGDLDTVLNLLDAGAEVNAKERKGQTALMWASAEGHLDVVKLLLDSGADPEIALKVSGYNAFFFAVREGHSDIVHHFLSLGVDLSKPMNATRFTGKLPNKGTTPLLLAVENGHFDLAVELLDAGADPNDMTPGFSILHALTWIRKPDIGESAMGAPPPKGSGKRNSAQFIRDLVARGADVNLRRNSGQRAGNGRVSFVGATPFFMAADRADLPYMKLLVELGADPHIPNEDGCTSLLVAAGVGSRAPEEEAGSEEECLAAAQFLVELGSDVNAVDANGHTAMHGAALKNIPSMVHYLNEQGADVGIWNRKNSDGWTPLLIAEGYRPGNFKPSFATVDAISEVMIANGAPIPTGPKPKHTNYAN